MSLIAFIVLFIWCASLSSRVSALESKTGKPASSVPSLFGAIAAVAIVIGLVLFALEGGWL